jgi:hypothetical protein
MESCKAMETEGQISNQIEWLVISISRCSINVVAGSDVVVAVC